jgi:hypothetical protein
VGCCVGARIVIDWIYLPQSPPSIDGSRRGMETEKVMTYGAMGIAGLVTLIFLLDAIFGIVGQNLTLDILFILGAAFVIWQSIETMREFR